MTKKKSAKPDNLDLDAILPELGQFGRYQRFVYSYLAVAIIFTSIYNIQYIFAAGAVQYRNGNYAGKNAAGLKLNPQFEPKNYLPMYYMLLLNAQTKACRVPACESSPAKFEPNGWAKFALPSEDYDCWQKVPIGSKCEPTSFSNQSRRCYSWVYENHLTIVPEFDLACEDWKRTLVGTIHNVGVFMAIPTTATISDAYGRRVALIGTAVLPAIFGMARAFCNNYLLYLFLEFIEALVGNGTYSTAFIIGLEIVGLKKRVIGGNIMHCSFATGQVVAALCAWALPYWRTYLLVVFTPSLLFIFYIFFVEESVRWLIVKGRRDEAVRIILKMAKINRVTLLPKTMNMLKHGPPKKSAFIKSISQRSLVVPEVKEPSLFKQVIRSKTIRFRMVVVSFWWISTTMIYYGLSINAVGLVGNKYINFIMTAVAEIPGSFLAYCTLDRFGRKSTMMTSYFMCAISLLSLPAVSNPKLMIALTLLGKMMISLIFCGIYIYTIELFPTKGRHTLMGFCSMTGRIGSMCAPQTPLLMKYMKSLPYLVFGTMAGISGLLMLLTPETLHMKLPDTIAQAEQMHMAARTTKVTNIIVDNPRVQGR